MFGDRRESLEDAGALGLDAPAQIEVVDLARATEANSCKCSHAAYCLSGRTWV